ncbi:ABC transporter ATP-binding protein [Gynuella sunshinyii]|uniref:ABC-type sugar transport system, ATPase component n=1 Tax=Gynuella sunshinyii YC6258 TaxID=1445510 RepID=A0A0C5VG36_9GAMM|nr:ABC transporter ATP-binding protein [Gynuella sunshinyii]AJQ93156.1 ABC-type sugar transport system, ATPase component [Gynuella sunshinyii YC6258]
MNSVSIRQLDLKYQTTHVLKGLNLDIRKGEFLVLLGSSGCGKSTLLNCIAGLLDISAGQIWINDRNVTWDEPKDRGIGMVFQSYALYPQMTVEKNLSFSLKVTGMEKAEIARRVDRAARILQIESLLQRKPSELSGGQRQRVAIGRALVRDVDVFLFDEPLSNLDAKLRADLRVEIKRLHQQLKNTMIYVTHDQVEALTLADRIAIMKNGEVQQLGTPGEIYHHPCNLFVARFIGSPGMNIIAGHWHEGVFSQQDFRIDLHGYEPETATNDEAVFLGIRPEHLCIEERPGSIRLSTVTIDIVEPMGDESIFWFELLDCRWSIKVHGDHDYHSGDPINIFIDPGKVHLFSQTTEDRL